MHCQTNSHRHWVILAQIILPGSALHFPQRYSHFKTSVALERRHKSFTWHGIPSTTTDCWLQWPTHFEYRGTVTIWDPDPDMVPHSVHLLFMLWFVWEDVINVWCVLCQPGLKKLKHHLWRLHYATTQLPAQCSVSWLQWSLWLWHLSTISQNTPHQRCQQCVCWHLILYLT